MTQLQNPRITKILVINDKFFNVKLVSTYPNLEW